MVVLSTSEAVSDLLDQRSVIYSDKVRVHRLKHIESQPLIVSLQAMSSNDRVVSPFDKLRLINLTCFLCVTQDGCR